MKKLLILSIALIAFACSKDEDNDPCPCLNAQGYFFRMCPDVEQGYIDRYGEDWGNTINEDTALILQAKWPCN